MVRPCDEKRGDLCETNNDGFGADWKEKRKAKNEMEALCTLGYEEEIADGTYVEIKGVGGRVSIHNSDHTWCE